MHRINISETKYSLPIKLIPGLLFGIGFCVLLSWHTPHTLASIYPFATRMAYNTAIGFIACGLGLIALIRLQPKLVFACALVLFVIAVLTLLDLVGGFNLRTTDWFVIMLSEPPVRNQPISPVTSIAFLMAGLSLLLGVHIQGTRTIVASLLCILIIFISTAAILGQGLGLFPTFVWMGIKMAPQTAIGLIAFAVAIIILRYHAAVDAFNRLNFFSRLTTGFIFMSLLFIGIGSIGLLQINSVASISQKLYQGPLQINNAALRIKSQIGKLNRAIKDVAVNPELVTQNNIPLLLQQITRQLHIEFALIDKEPLYAENLSLLKNNYQKWSVSILANHHQLEAGNVETYRQTTLHENQNTTVAMELLCDDIIVQAQAQMLELNEEAVATKNHAGNLMLVVISGFLLVGIVVAGLITRSLSWQLQRIRQAMLDISQGDSQIEIPFYDHPYEIGDMAKTLKIFSNNIDERNKSAQLLQQHQEDLEKTNLQLAQTNKELETFAYVASHDLKSPLRGIAQLSSWIEEDLESKEFAEVGKHTQMLRNRIQRMEKLLDDMLIFYRAGKVDGNITHIDLQLMATELFEIQNTKPGIRLELGDNLPVFDSLSTPFEQILRNLFSNAIKHHDLEQGVIRLEGKKLDQEFYEFSVCDDGPGIPAKFQERVFGMFQTLKPRDELEGSGMGLALIKKIVATYGGIISVHSEGRGCCFIFTWPQVIKRKLQHD
jgi:signal transduction histidine kinase